MRFWSRLRSRRPPPDFEITSLLSTAECLRVLTGKERSRRLGNEFASALRLDGRMWDDGILVQLPSGAVSGEIAAVSAGTRIRLWAREGWLDAQPAIMDSVVIVLVAAALVVFHLI